MPWGTMSQPSTNAWFTINVNWQRLLAIVCLVLAVVVLGFRFFVRPAVSTYVGQQVSERISAQVAEEISQAVIAGVLAPQSQTGGQGTAGGGNGSGAAGTGAQGPAIQPAQTPIPGQQQADAVVAAVVGQLDPSAQAVVEGAPAAGGSVGTGGGEVAGGAGAQTAPGPGATAGAGAPPIGEPGGPAAYPTAVVGTPIAAPGSERTIEQIVEALPPGEITVTEEKLNARIGPRVATMAPIERVEVNFVPGSVQVTLAVFGQTNLATGGLGLSGNRVIVRDPKLDGPLGLLVSPADLVRPIEDELNDTLELAGRQVRDVRIEEGKIVVTLN